MIVMHVMTNHPLPRLLTGAVERIADTMPVVVITGARQTGKSTLVGQLLPGQRAYYSLDELDVRAQAERSPDDLVERSNALVLDEVQRVPDLLLAVKRAVDRHRQPGRYILTSSANLLLMRSVSESLAGRAGYLTLWPMTRGEQMGTSQAGKWSMFFDEPPETWLEILAESSTSPSIFLSGGIASAAKTATPPPPLWPMI